MYDPLIFNILIGLIGLMVLLSIGFAVYLFRLDSKDIKRVRDLSDDHKKRGK